MNSFSSGDVGLLQYTAGSSISSSPSLAASGPVSRKLAQKLQSATYAAQTASTTPGEIFNVKWTKVNDGSSCPSESDAGFTPRPRHGHRAIAYENTILVFGGGNEGIVEGLHVFDVVTNQWSQPSVKGNIPAGRAAFGMVLDNHHNRILMFGGMTEHCHYSSDLYEFCIGGYEWRKLTPMVTRGCVSPCARFGHTFTIVEDRVYLFGGLANVGEGSETNIPQYLDDLYVLWHLQNNSHGLWSRPITGGNPPCPRESHSAVAYSSKDVLQYSRLFVFGGMRCYRLGDLYMLDLDTMMWSRLYLGGAPSPRSLHSATVVGEKMYIFGGWIPTTEKERNRGLEYKVSNELACFNLETLQWEYVQQEMQEDMVPRGRAGHSSVVINNRIYIWSGRDGYKKVGNAQVCLEDMWRLEVQKPGDPGKVQFSRSGENWLEVSWDPVPGADSYILQCVMFDASLEPKPISKPKSFPNPNLPQPSSQFRSLAAAGYPLTPAPSIMNPVQALASKPLMSTGWPTASSLYSLPANKASTASSLYASRSVARPLAVPATSAPFSYQPSGRGVLQVRTPAQPSSSSRTPKTVVTGTSNPPGATVLKTTQASAPNSSAAASSVQMSGMHTMADIAAVSQRIQTPTPASGVPAMRPQVFSEARRVTMSGIPPVKSAQFITTGGQIVTLNLPPGSYLPPGLHQLPLGLEGQQQQQINIGGKPVTLKMPEGQKMAFLPQTIDPPVITLDQDQDPSKPKSRRMDDGAGQKPTIPTSTAVRLPMGSVPQPVSTTSTVPDEVVGVATAAEGLIELAGGCGSGNQQQLVSGPGGGDHVNATPVFPAPLPQ